MEQDRRETGLGSPSRLAVRLAAGAVPAALLLPALALAGPPVHASPLVLAAAALVTLACAAVGTRLPAASQVPALGSLATLAVGCWLLAWVSYAGAGLVVAVPLGFATGQILRVRRDPVQLAALAAAVALVATLRAVAGIEWAALAVVAMAVVQVAGFDREARPGGPVPHVYQVTGASLGIAAAAFAIFWTGSTSPRVTWFGELTSHGPRNGNEVAITFDDGPNGNDTLAIAAILEQYGVRGTFFEVGKAVAEEPEVTRKLADAGHVIGNHSYEHDAFRFLDPRYPELGRANAAIRDALGVCPALFRPPHGTHTPFMSHEVSNHGMELVTWDVSAKDWIETDPARLAEHILAKVKPGSIILLHDGIDGIPPADRSVVVQALPAILEGLKARGLEPVTLDRLLDVRAYLPAGRC